MMKCINNNQINMNTKPSLSCRIITWLTSFFLIFQSIGPSFANVISDQSIESELSGSNDFIRELTNTYYQYIGSPYINASAPEGDLTSIEEMVDLVIDDYDYAVGGTTYVPIGTGGIQTFIPTHPSYRIVGDPLVQSRYVRAQIRAMLGRTLINTSQSELYGTEAKQLETLFRNAINYIQSDPSKRIGERLGIDQDGAALAAPMIWPELRTVHGEEVLVPIVYLTPVEIDRSIMGNTVELDQGGSFDDLIIEGTTVRLGRDAFLEVVNNLLNNQGAIVGDGDLNIQVGGQFYNLSGVIQAEGNVSIAAKSIRSGTIVHQYETRNGTAGYFGEIAEINSDTGDVVLTAYEDIVIAGSLISAGDDIIFTADGSIYIGTVNIRTSIDIDNDWRTSQGSSIEYLGSILSAEDSIDIIADGGILIDASEIIADKGHIQLLAGLGITIQDQLNTTQSYYKGKFGSTKKEVSVYKTVAMRSLLDAGRDLTIHALFGDITLKAADISTTQGTSVTASNGAINLLVTRETDHYSYSSVSESLFTVKTVNRGHEIETVVPTTIIGGFEANPLYGLNVEYEGNPDYTFDQQVNALAGMPGLEWIADIRARDDVNWTEVESRYEEWNERRTSLSPAAIALITIVITVASGGAAAAGGAIVGGSGAVTTAVGAAAISLGTASSIAQINALLNGENPFEAAFDTITSSEALRSAAIAAITAGAIAALDAEFFNVDTSAGETLSLAEQAAEAASNAAVSAGIEVIASGGDLGDFTDSFLDSLRSYAINIVGRETAELIGDTFDVDNPTTLDTALLYISHAGAGCLLGAASGTEDTESACYAGAAGAVIGEVIAQNYRPQAQEELGNFLDEQRNQLSLEGRTPEQVAAYLNSEQYRRYLLVEVNRLRGIGVDLSRLGGALGAFLTGGSASDIYTSAFTAQNAAANNSLRDLEVRALAILQTVVFEVENAAQSIHSRLTGEAGAIEEFLGDRVPQFGDWIESQGVELKEALVSGEDLTGSHLLINELVSNPLSPLFGVEPQYAAGVLAGLIELTVPAGEIADLVPALLAGVAHESLPDFITDGHNPYFDAVGGRLEDAFNDVVAAIENIDEAAVIYGRLSGLAVEGDYAAQARLARLSTQLVVGVGGGALAVANFSRSLSRILDSLRDAGHTLDDLNFALPDGYVVVSQQDVPDAFELRIDEDALFNGFRDGNDGVSDSRGGDVIINTQTHQSREGGLGGTSNPLNDTLEPNTQYQVETAQGNTTYIYETDANGSVINVSGDLDLHPAVRSCYQQGLASSCGLSTDDGGHLVGAQFDGPSEQINLVAQASQLNRGAGSEWRALETQWAQALSEGMSVSVNIRVNYGDPINPNRPVSFVVDYEIDGFAFNTQMFSNL